MRDAWLLMESWNEVGEELSGEFGKEGMQSSDSVRFRPVEGSVRVGPLRFCTQVTCGWQMGRSEKRTTEASGALRLVD